MIAAAYSTGETVAVLIMAGIVLAMLAANLRRWWRGY